MWCICDTFASAVLSEEATIIKRWRQPKTDWKIRNTRKIHSTWWFSSVALPVRILSLKWTLYLRGGDNQDDDDDDISWTDTFLPLLTFWSFCCSLCHSIGIENSVRTQGTTTTTTPDLIRDHQRAIYLAGRVRQWILWNRSEEETASHKGETNKLDNKKCDLYLFFRSQESLVGHSQTQQNLPFINSCPVPLFLLFGS